MDKIEVIKCMYPNDPCWSCPNMKECEREEEEENAPRNKSTKRSS